MSYAIVFSSKTGNTALLAQTLQEQLPQTDCCYFGAPDAAALAADTLYVGFWTDKGKADTDTLDFLQQLRDHLLLLHALASSRLCLYFIIHAPTKKPTHIFPPPRGDRKTVPGGDAGHRLFFYLRLTRACSRS